MTDPKQSNQVGRLHTGLGEDVLLIRRMVAHERMSEGFTIEIDALAHKGAAKVHKLLGAPVAVEFKTEAGGVTHIDRWFHGLLYEYLELERTDTGHLYRLTLRPWLAFRDLNRENKIFQDKRFKEIIETVMAGEDLELGLTSTQAPYEYCVQYQESDTDFFSRLSEEVGAYYYFEHSSSKHVCKLIDDRSSNPTSKMPTLAVVHTDVEDSSRPHLWSFHERRQAGVAAFNVNDYDFKKPSTDIAQSKNASPPGGDPGSRWKDGGAAASEFKAYEVFEHPARYREVDASGRGRQLAERWLESMRQPMAEAIAEGSCFAAVVGEKIEVEFPEDGDAKEEFLIIGARHDYEAGGYQSGQYVPETLSVELELMPAALQYRAPRTTPRPVVAGPQTAIVVGGAGEEIETDEYGRIRVHFYWDRHTTKSTADASCWIRVAQTSAGSGWGSFFLPRIGQEVVVSFLDGDPDRPLVTGVVYNAENMPAQSLPGAKNAQWIKTRSTKSGGGYNEIFMDDSKEKELFRIHAQKDLDTTVLDGDETRTLVKGNRTTTIEKGDDSLTLNAGNVTIKVAAGSHQTEAAQSIELKCGGSAIKMTPSEISISSVNIKINADMQLSSGGTMVESKASGVNSIQGAMVKVN